MGKSLVYGDPLGRVKLEGLLQEVFELVDFMQVSISEYLTTNKIS